MRSQIELLAAVQVIDQSLRTKTLELAEGDERVAALTEATRAQTAAAITARAEHGVLTARQRDLEVKLGAAEAKLKDRRMRITRIRNDKELGLAKREVDLLKEEIAGLEAELQQVYEQVEAATTGLAGLEGELKALAEAREAEAVALKDTIARLGADIERDRARRQSLIDTVDQELRRRYEMILSRRGGLAVVPVRDGTCQGCRMRVPPQLYNQIQRNEQVILCPSCQRILHWPPTQSEAS